MTVTIHDPLRYFGFLLLGLCYAGAAKKVRMILKADYPKVLYEELGQPRDLSKFDPLSIKWEFKFWAFIMLRKFTHLGNPELNKWGNLAFCLFICLGVWSGVIVVMSLA